MKIKLSVEEVETLEKLLGEVNNSFLDIELKERLLLNNTDIRNLPLILCEITRKLDKNKY